MFTGLFILLVCISNVVLSQELSGKVMNNLNFSSDDSTVNTILNELSSCFDSTYQELLFNLKHQSSYEQLRNYGEQQFYNPESTRTMEEHSHQTKEDLCVVHFLSLTVDSIIDAVISQKFQGNFLTKLKEEVLKIVFKLYSDQDSSAQEESISTQPLQSAGNPEVKQIEDMQIILDKLTSVKKYLSQNLNDMSKNAIDMSFENAVGVSENAKTLVSNITEENIMEISNDSIDLGNLSFDSISSVHTSDLSSFNDEISISSDEEFGRKRKKLSLKLAEEEVNQIRAKKKKDGKNKKTQAKRITPKNVESEVLTNGTSSVQQKSLPSRIRKPNSKYNEFDIISPLNKKSIEKSTQNKNSTSVQESETVNSLPRKRGRPRAFSKMKCFKPPTGSNPCRFQYMRTAEMTDSTLIICKLTCKFASTTQKEFFLSLVPKEETSDIIVIIMDGPNKGY